MCANIDWLHRDIIQNVDPAFRYMMKWTSLINSLLDKIIILSDVIQLKDDVSLLIPFYVLL